MFFLKSVCAQREISFSHARIFAAEAVICTLAALAIYNWAGEAGGMWAAVSAISSCNSTCKDRWPRPSFAIANLIGVGTA